ncbi:conserved hypothetical protein [Ricinus communis]|uniref:Uncharacterized protein n=1 Tax=Ricinus communis TaxID=3988 RepID=B9TBP9_RICCO|nr:conserved hypothetical protein [Ricinus communis]
MPGASRYRVGMPQSLCDVDLLEPVTRGTVLRRAVHRAADPAASHRADRRHRRHAPASRHR